MNTKPSNKMLIKRQIRKHLRFEFVLLKFSSASKIIYSTVVMLRKQHGLN